MKKQNKKKIKKGAWFYPLRGSYLPCAWQGWLVEIAILVAFLLGLYAFNEQELSMPIVAVIMVPYTLSLGIIATWVAKQKS